MQLEVDGQTALVFDLDDTLYKERDFQTSGFKSVLSSVGRASDEKLLAMMLAWNRVGRNAFAELIEHLDLDIRTGDLLERYRSHTPMISLSPGAPELLGQLGRAGVGLALVTDGRSSTQHAKLRALEIDQCFDVVVISEEVGSEKPDPRNFRAVGQAMRKCSSFVFVADNPRKDFVTPNALGWKTIQLDDDGRNIHSQTVQVPDSYQALFRIASLEEIVLLI